MPSALGVVEAITPAKSCLVGSIAAIGASGQPPSPAISAQLLASRSLKIAHPFGLVSSQVRAAMLRKTLLPTLEIHTSEGVFTLVNANIVKIGPYRPPAKPAGTHSSGINTHELEEFDFTFQRISVRNLSGSSSATDDWSIGTGGKKKKK